MGETPKKPITENERSQATRAIQKTGEVLSWVAGFISLPWLKNKSKTKITRDVPAWAISADGALSLNPEWLQGARPDERVFNLAHGQMRFLMRHHDRGVDLGAVDPVTGGAPEGQEHQHKLWGEASASVVNAALKSDMIGRPPADAVFPPHDYAGSLDAESLYLHLLKTRPPPPPGQGGGQSGGAQPPPQAGGHPQPPQAGEEPAQGEKDGQGGNAPQPQGGGAGAPPTSDEIDEMRRQVEALARQAGIGKSICEALRPKITRTNYRAIIGAGLDCASTEASDRTHNTYARASRREGLMEGLVLPGKIGTDPSICVVFDASGSVARGLLKKAAGECLKLATEFPHVRIYLVTHTSEVCWEGWIRAGGSVRDIEAATAFTGGTDFEPAYLAAAKVAPRGKFDALVHFTDGENGGEWPMPPARRLIVGLCGNETLPQETPIRAKVIPVTEAEA